MKCGRLVQHAAEGMLGGADDDEAGDHDTGMCQAQCRP